MTGRNLTSGFISAIEADHVKPFPLIQIDFSSGTEYWCTLAHDVVYGGNTYTALADALGIEEIEETASSSQGLKLMISAAEGSNLALALAEPMQGRAITVRLAVVDSAGALQVDATVWKGRLDYPQIQDGKDQCVVVLYAEHQMAAWDRPRPVRYTDAAQQALYPGDLGCEFVAATAEATIVWPSREFFKQ